MSGGKSFKRFIPYPEYKKRDLGQKHFIVLIVMKKNFKCFKKFKCLEKISVNEIIKEIDSYLLLEKTFKN